MMAVTPSEVGFDAKLVYEIVRDILIFAAFLYAAVRRGRAANKSEIEAVRQEHGERLDRHSEKLTQFDERMKAMPKHDDLENLHERINRVNESVSRVDSKVSGIQGGIEGMKNSLSLLTRHHIGEGK